MIQYRVIFHYDSKRWLVVRILSSGEWKVEANAPDEDLARAIAKGYVRESQGKAELLN